VSETKRHLEARTALYLLLKDALTGHALGSDQFVYFDATDPKRCISPDVFVRRGSSEANFDVWKVWENGAPHLAVEIVSASDRRDQDWEDKLARYRASGIHEVVRFDSQDAERPIRVWDRVEDDLLERAPELVERPQDSAHLRECVTLGLWWAVAPSEYGPQLRLARDREGKDLLPTPVEERVRLAQELAEERKARAAAEHERLLAEHAKRLAEQRLRDEAEARQREAEARQREAEARQREAEARTAAERERDAALAELAKLRARLGEKG
jgi:Uma2 family endonuclease